MDRRDFLKNLLAVAALAPVSKINTAFAAPAEKPLSGKVSRRRLMPVNLITLGTGAGNPSMTRDNSCTFLQAGKYSYLIDAGCHVSSKIIRKGLDFNDIKAVFITHMHEDHFGGLTSFLKNRMVKNGPYNRPGKWKGFWPEVWMPEADGIKAFDMLMQVAGYQGRERITWKLIKPGLFYDDGYLKATAIPNKHIKSGDGFRPSYCFLFEVEGKKILCTGDLRSDLSDFPVEAAKDADLVMCENTHFLPVKRLDIFKSIKPGKLIFNHNSERNTAQFEDVKKAVNYPVFIANDGDEFTVE